MQQNELRVFKIMLLNAAVIKHENLNTRTRCQNRKYKFEGVFYYKLRPPLPSMFNIICKRTFINLQYGKYETIIKECHSNGDSVGI